MVVVTIRPKALPAELEDHWFAIVPGPREVDGVAALRGEGVVWHNVGGTLACKVGPLVRAFFELAKRDDIEGSGFRSARHVVGSALVALDEVMGGEGVVDWGTT